MITRDLRQGPDQKQCPNGSEFFSFLALFIHDIAFGSKTECLPMFFLLCDADSDSHFLILSLEGLSEQPG